LIFRRFIVESIAGIRHHAMTVRHYACVRKYGKGMLTGYGVSRQKRSIVPPSACLLYPCRPSAVKESLKQVPLSTSEVTDIAPW